MHNEARVKRNELEESRVEYMMRAKKLLEASMKGKYDKVVIDLAVEKELDIQTKEMDKYKTLVEELKNCVGLVRDLEEIESKYTQEIVKLKDVCQMNTGEAPSGKVALVKGNTSMLISYDMIKKTKEEIKINGYTAPMNYSGIEVKDLLYIIGGNRINQRGFNIFLKDFVSITLNNGTWSSLEPLKEACRRTAVASISGKYIYVMGGDSEAGFLRTCERYDISTNKWASCPPLTEEKTNASAGVFRAKIIYLFGGYNKTEKELKTIEKFDTENDKTWMKITLNTDSIAQNMGVIQISHDEMLLFGGMKNSSLQTQTFIFKVEGKKLEKVEDMKKAESFSMAKPKSLIFTVFGLGSHFNDLQLFDTNTKKWTIISQ